MSRKRKIKPVEFCLQAPSGLEVFVAGTFNDWDCNCSPLTEQPTGGTYTLTLQLPPGTHQYRFVVEGEWRADPQNPATAPDGYGALNSVLNVE